MAVTSGYVHDEPRREFFAVMDAAHYQVTAGGRCPQCNSPIAGRFDQYVGAFGQRRIPLRPNPDL